MMVDPVIKVKKLFFESEKTRRFLDRKRRKALMKSGAFVRRTAQFSMKSRKRKSSQPGQPPHKRNRKLLSKLLFFSYDERTDSVVIGPIIFDQSTTEGLPKLMEKGGTVTHVTVYKNGRQKVEQAKYPARPFMMPALLANRGKIAEFMGKV